MCLFIKLTGQEIIATISRMILYILHFIVKKILSLIEENWFLSKSHPNYHVTKGIFFLWLLIWYFSIMYCCQFPNLIISKRVNSEIDPFTFCYQGLWRHKTSLYFYKVYNDFVSVFKGLLFGKNTPRISDQANKFLENK